MNQIISDAALTEAIVNELRTGRQFLDSLQKYRERDAREEAAKYRKAGKKRSHGWKHLAEIPAREYLQMIHKYGHDEVQSREFIRDFQQREPDLAGPYKA